jgi:hypothetical protein
MVSVSLAAKRRDEHRMNTLDACHSNTLISIFRTFLISLAHLENQSLVENGDHKKKGSTIKLEPKVQGLT